MFAHRYREHGWRQPRRLRSSSIHPTQGTQFRGPRDAPSRAQRMPSRRRSVGRSVSAGAKTGTTRTGWRAAGQGAWSTPALPPHVALPCPARRCHVIQPIPFGSPTCFFAFHGDKQARGLSCFWLASWPVRPSVGCGTVPAGTYPFPSGRRMHACRLPPAGKDLDLTVSPSWEGRPSLASGHAVCLPALPGRFAWSSSSFPAGRCLGRAENLGRARGRSWVVPSISRISFARHRGLFV